DAVLALSPFLPYGYVAALAALALAVFAAAKWRRAPDFYWRGGVFAVIALLLLNPLMVRETRQGLPAKLVIVMDESPSQSIAGRGAAAEKILARLKTLFPEAEPVVIRAGQDPASLRNQNTSLFTALRNNLMGIPLGQVVGTVLVTDGQVHDVPETLGPLEKLAPFNVILTGKKGEFDRKVTVTEAPKYGLLDQEVSIRVKVEDAGKSLPAPVVLKVMQDGKLFGQYTVAAGEAQDYAFRLDHVGQNVFEFSVAAAAGELTEANNTAAVIVNGVRDRLRVLLVSGQPHIGERAWRDLLKSDPAIDLVHFTILRSPMSFDNTPTREMSLIAFPVEELFQKKIRDFDLIIFDKYAQYGLLQPQYFVNIASFVKEGGAFLMAMGSDRPEQSLFKTALGDILPIEPKPDEQSILSGPFLPQLTALGKSHPVTVDLQAGQKPWGQWFSQADVNQTRGQTLMTGAEGKPLLILDKAGDGRVAVLTSDNIWLWSKGVNGGGPHTELLRHVAHWLMKEPELEEDYIKAEVRGNVITVAERDLGGGQKNVTMTHPDGKDETIPLLTREKGWFSNKVIAGQNGIYRFSNGSKTAFAVVGTAMSEEFSDVHTSEDRLKPLADKTKGAVIWYSERPQFTAGDLRLKDSAAYSVSSVESVTLIPNGLAVLIIFGGLVYVWRRESGSRKNT
ncbi:MAG: hypothetical protein K8R48_07105, partial [Alphaproteobacteria bacterium]|nr:hypothetical protein [Alphaproteobacteria bacterium]